MARGTTTTSLPPPARAASLFKAVGGAVGGLGACLPLWMYGHRLGLSRSWAPLFTIAAFALGSSIGARIGIGISRYLARLTPSLDPLRTAHPEQPWMWDREWAARRITDSPGSSAIALTLVSVVVGLPFWLVGVAIFDEGALGGGTLFSLIGLACVAVTVDSWMRTLAFGKSYLRLETLPGVVGRELAGTVEAHLQSVDPDQRFTVGLSCTRPGKPSKTMWQTAQVVGSDGWRRQAGPIEIPCRFRIPVNVPPTAVAEQWPAYYWRLSVSTMTPRGGYQADFVVPVFRTAESEQPLPPLEPAPAPLPAADAANPGPDGQRRPMSPRTKTALRVIFGGLILAWGVGQLHVIPKHRPP